MTGVSFSEFCVRNHGTDGRTGIHKRTNPYNNQRTVKPLYLSDEVVALAKQIYCYKDDIEVYYYEKYARAVD